MNNLIEIIKSIDSTMPKINPTLIYNEGWMIRLLVYHSFLENLRLHNLDFSKIKNWCSDVTAFAL